LAGKMARKKVYELNPDDIITIAGLTKDISYIKDEITEIKVKLESKYVTQTEFEPVKRIVYGLVGLILVAVVGSLLGLILLKP
jgi:hypothetical protein